MHRETKACLKISFVNILWGLSFIASKTALANGFSPFWLAFVRFAIATALLLPLLKQRKGRLRLEKGSFWRMLCSGLLGITLYFAFEHNGLARTSASTASLIIAAIPAFTLLYGVLFKRQRPPLLSYLGVGASLLGVFLIVFFGSNEGQDTLAGSLLLICACLCWVGYMQVTETLTGQYTSLEITFWQSLLGAAALLPCALGLEGRMDWSATTPLGWAMVLYLSILCSVVAYLLYVDAVRELKPLRTAIFINLNPLAGVLGGVLLLGERLSPVQLLGGLIVLVSIFLVNRRAGRG
ncbi:MAG: DMT family transporter [Candidatus Excrementavichristensenella sp.]|jgi:drug/metabolite transporter (DMT)-like permease